MEKVAGTVAVVSEVVVSRLNSDLTASADIARAALERLASNGGLVARGFMVAGAGFILEADEAADLRGRIGDGAALIRPFRNGKDLTARPRGVYVIDFGLRSEEEAREYPVLFDIVRDRVKPERDANPDKSRREKWWLFGRTNEDLRAALSGLTRYIATAETSKHRFFTFVDGEVAPDNAVVCIASEDSALLGILSSTIHVAWALAAGGRMGVRDTPRYNKGVCFESFPFPTLSAAQREQIGQAAEALERHRTLALAADPDVTIMKMYDIVTALRAGLPLTASQQRIHALAACGVLKDLHDTLDEAVAGAYGWEWPLTSASILERLVALHDERRREERAGLVRWLRPDYQAVGHRAETTTNAVPSEEVEGETPATPVTRQSWPTDAVGQITALRQVAALAPITVDEAVARFVGAPKTIVARHLETLAILGELRLLDGGRYAGALAAA